MLGLKSEPGPMIPPPHVRFRKLAGLLIAPCPNTSRGVVLRGGVLFSSNSSTRQLPSSAIQTLPPGSSVMPTGKNNVLPVTVPPAFGLFPVKLV